MLQSVKVNLVLIIAEHNYNFFCINGMCMHVTMINLIALRNRLWTSIKSCEW